MLNSKIVKKTKSTFMIYADFEGVLVPEDNGKQNQTSFIKPNIKSTSFAVIAIS